MGDNPKATAESAPRGTAKGANHSNSSNLDEPPLAGVDSSAEADASIEHGDPHLVFDDRHQSAALKEIRSQFLESADLAGESSDRFYERMFSKANFRAFHAGLSQAIKKAREVRAVDPGDKDLVSFMTGAGLLVVVSWDQESGNLHISMEQQLRPTTHATCSFFGHFALTMLRENDSQMAVTPYFTDSGVHHLVLRFQPNVELKVRDFDSAREKHVADYEPIHFRYAPEMSVPGGRKTHAKSN